jgi:hypothetical protein
MRCKFVAKPGQIESSIDLPHQVIFGNRVAKMGKLAAYEKQMLASPDSQISLTDPDSRSMATSGRGSGVVGYNVQVAVDTVNHLIVIRICTDQNCVPSTSP